MVSRCLKKKRKSSLGRLTANAKYKQKTRLNEDEKTYSQRTEIEKERQVIGRINENSEHRDQRLAVRRYKDNLTSKTIIKEHQKAVKNASPVVSQVVSRTRGALKLLILLLLDLNRWISIAWLEEHEIYMPSLQSLKLQILCT